MSECKVRFAPADVSVDVDPAKPVEGIGPPGTLLNIAIANGVEIEHPCEGEGTCGLCCVTIEQGLENLSRPSDDERSLIEQLAAEPDASRLACQAVVRGNVVCRTSG